MSLGVLPRPRGPSGTARRDAGPGRREAQSRRWAGFAKGCRRGGLRLVWQGRTPPARATPCGDRTRVGAGSQFAPTRRARAAAPARRPGKGVGARAAASAGRAGDGPSQRATPPLRPSQTAKGLPQPPSQPSVCSHATAAARFPAQLVRKRT